MPKQLNCYYSIISMTYLPIKSELYSSKLLSNDVYRNFPSLHSTNEQNISLS